MNFELALMTIYWNKASIPALKGLSREEQAELILPIWSLVWLRWQVWLPVLIQIVLLLTFVVLAPQFPYRFPVLLAMVYLTVKLAFLPYHHFLALELEKQTPVGNDYFLQLIKKLIPRWNAQHVGLMPASSVHEIRATFAQLGSKASSDVVKLYSAVGGMRVMDDDACWRLWSLAEIIEENKEPSPYGVLFSDHLIESWCYRLKYETDERSSVYVDYFDSSNLPTKLFDGLEEFFIAYERDPDAILG